MKFSLNVLTTHARSRHGFTLIEILIVVAIVAILAAIAMPSYTRFITKSQARAASADLVTLSLVLENRFQKNLIYPTYSNAIIAPKHADRTPPMANDFAAWIPVQGDLFDYKITSTDGSYTLTAARKSGTCTLTLDDRNVRNAASTCAVLGVW
jgi:type IV pilus assembly protein PilE